jgi:hypothetical protein
MKKGKTPEEALSLGKKMCEKLPTLYNECVDLCKLDYSAVELNEKYTSTQTKSDSIQESFDSSRNKSQNSLYDKLIMGMFIASFIVCLYVIFVKIFQKTN